MGKVIVTIQSGQIPTPTLREAVRQILPSEEEFKSALLKLYGFEPAELEIHILPAESEEGCDE